MEQTQKNVSITYNFNMWEDQEGIRNLTNHLEAYRKLNEIFTLVRCELKHGEEELSDHIERLLEQIKEVAWVE